MIYKVIQTGSDGNAILVNGQVLLDCGVAYQKIQFAEEDLRLVLLTHIHADHFRHSTVRRLAEQNPLLRFGCCPWMYEPLIGCNVSRKNIDVYQPGQWYRYKQFQVSPVHLYHDVPNCGYKVHWNGEKLFYATDTGSLEGIEAKGYDVYLVEANYEEQELLERVAQKKETGEYIYEFEVIKRHLSRAQCDNFIYRNITHGEYVYLHQHKAGTKEDGQLPKNDKL